MLPVIWLPGAGDDLERILDYIAEQNPSAAIRLKERIEASVILLAEHPYLYRKSDHVPGLREIVAHPNYIVLYRVTVSSVEIVSVVHSRRQFP
jgi:toxin ParE1/3/4